MGEVTSYVGGPVVTAAQYTELQQGIIFFPDATTCALGQNGWYMDMEGVPVVSTVSFWTAGYWEGRNDLSGGVRHTHTHSDTDLSSFDKTTYLDGGASGNNILYVSNSDYSAMRIFFGESWSCSRTIGISRFAGGVIDEPAGFDVGTPYVGGGAYESWGYLPPDNTGILTTVKTITDVAEWPCKTDVMEGVLYYAPNYYHGICGVPNGKFLMVGGANGNNTLYRLETHPLSTEFNTVGDHSVWLEYKDIEETLHGEAIYHHELWWPTGDPSIIDPMLVIGAGGIRQVHTSVMNDLGTLDPYCRLSRWMSFTKDTPPLTDSYAGMNNCVDSWGNGIGRARPSYPPITCHSDEYSPEWFFDGTDFVLSPEYPGVGGNTRAIIRNPTLPEGWDWDFGSGPLIKEVIYQDGAILEILNVNTGANRNVIQIDVLTNTIIFSHIGEQNPTTCRMPITSTSTVWSEWLPLCVSERWECPGDGAPAVWMGDGAPTGTAPDCTGEWSCPGNGDLAIWSNPDIDPYGTVPDCTGSWECPGDGADPEWSNSSIVPYGSIPSCVGEYICPGNGADPVWSNPTVVAYGTVPDCVGSWSCPGNGADPVWSNPDVTPYIQAPTCAGYYNCPGNGADPVWVGDTAPYGEIPDCTGVWECPGNGAGAVWSNPDVTPYAIPPNCSGSWECPGGGGAAVWSNPDIEPYTNSPLCEQILLNNIITTIRLNRCSFEDYTFETDAAYNRTTSTGSMLLYVIYNPISGFDEWHLVESGTDVLLTNRLVQGEMLSDVTSTPSLVAQFIADINAGQNGPIIEGDVLAIYDTDVTGKLYVYTGGYVTLLPVSPVDTDISVDLHPDNAIAKVSTGVQEEGTDFSEPPSLLDGGNIVGATLLDSVSIDGACEAVIGTVYEDPMDSMQGIVNFTNTDGLEKIVYEWSDDSTDGFDGNWTVVGESVIGDILPEVNYIANTEGTLSIAKGWRIRIPAIGLFSQDFTEVSVTLNHIDFQTEVQEELTFASYSSDSSAHNYNNTDSYYSAANHKFGIAATGGILGKLYARPVSALTITINWKLLSAPRIDNQAYLKYLVIETSNDSTDGFDGTWRPLRVETISDEPTETDTEITISFI